MKTAIISSKQLADTRCWSALRFCDCCEDCKGVQKCELPEARKGRVRLIQKRVNEIEKKLSELLEQLRRETE